MIGSEQGLTSVATNSTTAAKPAKPYRRFPRFAQVIVAAAHLAIGIGLLAKRARSGDQESPALIRTFFVPSGLAFGDELIEIQNAGAIGIQVSIPPTTSCSS